MGKHTHTDSVSRAGLVRRYAALRGLTRAAAEAVTRTWSRTELRDIIELGENEDLDVTLDGTRPNARHRRDEKGRTTTVGGYVTMVDGVTR